MSPVCLSGGLDGEHGNEGSRFAVHCRGRPLQRTAPAHTAKMRSCCGVVARGRESSVSAASSRSHISQPWKMSSSTPAGRRGAHPRDSAADEEAGKAPSVTASCPTSPREPWHPRRVCGSAQGNGYCAVPPSRPGRHEPASLNRYSPGCLAAPLDGPAQDDGRTDSDVLQQPAFSRGPVFPGKSKFELLQSAHLAPQLIEACDSLNVQGTRGGIGAQHRGKFVGLLQILVTQCGELFEDRQLSLK